MHLIRHSLSPRTEEDSCMQGWLRPSRFTGNVFNTLFLDYGVPISPNGVMRAYYIDVDFPKVVLRPQRCKYREMIFINKKSPLSFLTKLKNLHIRLQPL